MAFNPRQYINKYNKDNYKLIPIRVRKDSELVLQKLNEVKSVNNYIISLVENDITPNVLTLKQIKDKIKPILNKYGIFEIYLFGSYARGEAKANSDVDIYCEPGKIKTLIDQGKLEEELTKSLGKNVDLIFTHTKIDDFFKSQIEKDLIKLC